MTVRVLCTGDIHIGRRASRVGSTYRTADAWQAIVDLAIARQVDLLAVSGDVVDKESKSYEALGPLQDGLSRLNQAGIETVAVAGNHDHDVLVRLTGIAGTERFHLLGAGGVWDRFTLTRGDTPVLHVDGWSFPKEHVTESPMRQYPNRAVDGVPVLGLVHGEVSVPLSRYAPIALDDLWAAGADVWLLGHIHAPGVWNGPGGRRAFYPGSPWALDPGEPGTHGVWMVELGGDQPGTPEQIPISPVRYDVRTVDLTGVTDETGFQAVLNGALTALGRSALAEHGEDSLRVVSARLRLTGHCAAHRWVAAWANQAMQDMREYSMGSLTIELDGITTDVRPAIDVADLATGTDPVAETARLLLALDQPALAPLYEELVMRTLRDVQGIQQLPGYASLSVRESDRTNDGPTLEDAKELLRMQAWNLLSMLVSQKETA